MELSHEEKIKQFYEEMDMLRLENHSYKKFKKLVAQMLQSIANLVAEEPDEEKRRTLQTAWTAIASTSERDVENIRYYEKLIKVKNPPQIRRKEYLESVARAINQVYMDLFCII